MFRSKGLEVSVEPEDGTRLCYLTKKGWQDFLAGLALAEKSAAEQCEIIANDLRKIGRDY